METGLNVRCEGQYWRAKKWRREVGQKSPAQTGHGLLGRDSTRHAKDGWHVKSQPRLDLGFQVSKV